MSSHNSRHLQYCIVSSGPVPDDCVCVIDDGNAIGDGTPRAMSYDDDLLAATTFTPPTSVRIARAFGLDAAERPPVTEAELVDRLAVDGSVYNSGLAASDD